MEVEATHPRLKVLLRYLRYGAIVLSLATVMVAIGHTVPELRRSIQDLHLVETRDRGASSVATDLESTLARDSDLYVQMVGGAQLRRSSPLTPRNWISTEIASISSPMPCCTRAWIPPVRESFRNNGAVPCRSLRKESKSRPNGMTEPMVCGL